MHNVQAQVVDIRQQCLNLRLTLIAASSTEALSVTHCDNKGVGYLLRLAVEPQTSGFHSTNSCSFLAVLNLVASPAATMMASFMKYNMPFELPIGERPSPQ